MGKIVYLTLMVGCFFIGCTSDQKARKTSGLADDTVKLIDSASSHVGEARVTVDSMTASNLTDTKPAAQTHLKIASENLNQASSSAVATKKSSAKDEALIANYESNDPLKIKLEWLAGICAIIGVIGIGLGAASYMVTIPFITGQLQRLCFAIGGAGIASAIITGWIVSHWSQIQAGLTVAIITGGVSAVIYVCVMHGSARNGAWAFVGAIEAFFVGLLNNIKSALKISSVLASGKTGGETLLPDKKGSESKNG